MKPLNPRICLALTKAANGQPLDDSESRSLHALSTWIFDGCPERGGATTGRMIVPKDTSGRTPEPWEYGETLTGLAPLDYEAAEEKATDILLTEPAASEYHLGKSQVVQYETDPRF